MWCGVVVLVPRGEDGNGHAQNLIPDYRVGQGDGLGIEAAAKAAADGCTVLLTSPAISLVSMLDDNVAFDPFKDFVAIVRVSAIENVMVVHPSVPVRTLKDFIALARKLRAS